MDIQVEKGLIKMELDKVDDIHLVEAIKSILAFGKSRSLRSPLQQMTKDEFLERDEASQKSIDEGDLISQEDARLFFAKKHAG
ncbi:MAG: hypothetical protein HEP71_23525 [Roseivirga sp.]|nr:hypothetical protein [Roseivirga sp.]